MNIIRDIAEVSASHKDGSWQISVIGDTSTVLTLYMYIVQAVAQKCNTTSKELLDKTIESLDEFPKLDDIAECKYKIAIPKPFDNE